MGTTTETIAGHEITLQKTVRYLAARQMAKEGRKLFTVTIYILGDDMLPYKEIPDLTYTQANEFINEFNNGIISFAGRVW